MPTAAPPMRAARMDKRDMTSVKTMKTKGDAGHPWGTPEKRGKLRLRYPFTTMRREGGASTLYTSLIHVQKGCGP